MKLKKLISTVLSLLVLFETQANVFAVNGAITYSPDGPNWTNTDVVATLTGDYDAIDNNGGSNTYTFSDNGSFPFNFSSGGAETGSATATVNRIDKIPPTFFGIESGTIYTGTIQINFADANLMGATLNGNPYNSGDPISTIGTYTFQVSDLAGNTTGAVFEITTPIDIIPPTASIEYSPSTITNGDVLAIITGFSENITGLNVTGNLFTGNGTFDFIYRDLAGNTGTTTANVNRIDKTAPTATIIYSTTGDTNQDVIASITGFSENITGLNTTGTIFSINGSFVFTYQDDAGNLGSTTATVSRIDKTPITASINYTPASPTNTDVTATIGGFNKTGVAVIGGNSNIFTTNGSYVFDYQDLAGNTGSMTATVNRIDKQLPTFVGISNGASYNTPVNITFSDDNTGVTATINGSPYSNGEVLSGRGSQTLIVTDAAGNTTGATFQLDTTTPTISLIGSGIINIEVYNPYVEFGAIWFDNNITGSVSNIIGAINTSLLGTYIHQYEYSDGQNTGSTTRTINICDATLPIVTLNGSGTVTLERTNTYFEDGAIWSDNYDGTGTISTIFGSVDTQTVGSYTLTYQKIDSSGNTGSAIRTINIIDTTAPSASITYSITGITNQDIVATISGFSEIISGLNTPSYTFTSNGTFNFTYLDLAGNTGTTTATVNWIDKTPIISSIVYTPASLTNTDVVAAITGFNKTGINIIGGNTFLFTGNGTYTFDYQDPAGNTGSATAIVSRIDKINPTATTITYSITGITNQDVVATISGFSETISGLNTPSYTFTSNGTFNFTYLDLAGNTGTTTATVNWIDKTPIISSIVYTPASLTNTDVVATITGFNKTGINIIGGNTFLFTGNGTYTFDYQDPAGNTGSATAIVSRIDKINPTASIRYSPSGPTRTNGTVFAQITGFSETTTGLNASGYLFLTNGSFVFTYLDLAGNTGDTTATVNRIDVTQPTVTTGIVSAGNTGLNGANMYYNGAIDIKANITDAGGAGLNGATCEYTLNNGATRNPASYNTTYCSLTSLTPASNINVGFRIKDNANNLTTGSTSSYLFDNIVPTTTDNAPIISGKNNITVTLTAVDTGVGLSGTLYCIDTGATCTPNTAGTTVNVTCAAGSLCNQYIRYSSTDKLGNTENIKTSPKIIIDKISPTATIIYTPVSGTRTNTNITATITGFNKAITGLNATGNLFAANGSFTFSYQDLVGNTGTTTATVSRIDKTVPTVTAGIISAGTTGLNGATLYYNGTITLRADVADIGGSVLSGATCQYTLDGSTWNTATYNTTYCSVTGLNPATNITIRFRIQDTAGNLTTGNTGTYLFDNIIPTTTVLPTSSTGNVNITGTLTPIDTGAGILNTQYCIDTSNSCIPSTIGTIASVTGTNGTIVTKYLRYRSTDKVNNIEATKSVAYTIDKILPSNTGATTIYSNNATNINYGNINDIVTILFTTNKTLAALPTLTISGGSLSAATVTSLGANSYSASYTMKAADIEGQTKFVLSMIDTVGNTGTSLLTGIIFDKTNPTGLTITSPSTGHYVDGNLYTITWGTGTEANFGPTSIKLEYSTTNFASSIIITTGTNNNGTYTFAFPNTLNTIGKIRLTATDLAGNSFIITGSDFIFDTTPPTDISVTTPGLYLAGNKNYTLNRSGGIDANPQSITIYYSTDGTTYTAIPSCTKTNNEQSCIWTTPALNSNTVTLRAIAKDKVNQTKLWTTTNFTIDSIAPTLTFTGNSNWRTTGITGSATATDALAGISGTILYNTIAYTTSCNTGSAIAPYYTDDGIRTGYTCSIDNAGNIRTGTMAYKIDQTAPSLTMNTGTIQTNTGITINITGSDATAGISGFQRSKISGTGTITFSNATGSSSKLTASTDGTYSIQVIVKDNANNTTTGTFTLIWDTTAPSLSGSTVSISNQTATYKFTSDTTGSIIYSGTCGTGSLSTANATGNSISRTLSNATYSGCTITINDIGGNSSSLVIPSFTINYTAPSASAGGGGGGGGGGNYSIPICENTDLVCTNNIYTKKAGYTCEKGNLGQSCGSTGITTGTETTVSTSNSSAFTYALQNKFLPSSRQKNYVSTGIVTKESLTILLTTRSKNILKKTVKNITLYTSSGTNRMTRENVAKTIAKFVRNTEYKTGTALQGLKNKGIITNISYPKNRELNDNILTIMMRLYKQQTNTGTVKSTTKPTSILPTPVKVPTTNTESGLSTTGTITDTQRTAAEQKFISSMKTNFQFTEGYKRGTTNTAIKYLQYFLKINNYYTGPINGSNNDATTKGLFARQAANNLITDSNDPAAGYLGPKTREVINAKLKELLQ